MVRRDAAKTLDVILAVSPTALYDDRSKPAAIRAGDLTNASGIAISTKAD